MRERAIRNGDVAAVMVIPRDLPAQLQRDHENEIDIPIQYNSVDEPSQITYLRLRELVGRWRKSIVDSRLKRDQKTQSYAEPIQVKARGRRDRARGGQRALEPAVSVLARHDVADRGVLPGRRPVCRRERARDDGNAVDQSGEPVGDRAGEVL